MVSRVPLILEIMSKGNILEECYELLYLVSSACEAAGVINPGGLMRVIAHQMSDLPDGSHAMKLSSESMTIELSLVVAAVARQFAPLGSMPDNTWADYMRTGVVSILQNHVAPSEKLHALIIVESLMSILGEKWLIGRVSSAGVRIQELAYMKYEATSPSSDVEEHLLKQRYLAIAFSLVEKIIKYISPVGENEGTTLNDETVFLKVVKTLNETVGVVLEYLKDAKEHVEKRGNNLLASVRVIGSYLAETPDACKDQDEGCELLAASRGYIAVVECLVKLIQSDGQNGEEDSGSIFLACDTVMNILLKREKIRFSLGISTFSSLLNALAYWADEALLKQPSFNASSLDSLAGLIARSLSSSGQDTSDTADLLELITAGASGRARIFLDWD
uniref:Neurochondrin n=1 Tax=Brassica oleracea var. oleracea TaxID=109376 RepID=A0A0D3DC02_BRAOL